MAVELHKTGVEKLNEAMKVTWWKLDHSVSTVFCTYHQFSLYYYSSQFILPVKFKAATAAAAATANLPRRHVGISSPSNHKPHRRFGIPFRNSRLAPSGSCPEALRGSSTRAIFVSQHCQIQRFNLLGLGIK